MNYNLTTQQARHFIDTGRLLVVSKIEPQPTQIDENGAPHFDGVDPIFGPFCNSYDFPFTRVR